MNFTKVAFKDDTGLQQSVEVTLQDYKSAERMKLTLPQYINRKYKTDPTKFGTAFAQMVASAGLFVTSNNDYGIKPPTMQEIMDGDIQMGAIIAPDGSQSDTPAGRLFFPAVLLQIIESNLRPNLDNYIGSFMEMVATTVNINSPKYEQVVIDYTSPRAARGQAISQLALPPTMLTITASGTARTIPTISIGMMIAKEALALATLDLVGAAVSEQSINERAARFMNDFLGIVQGNLDTGDTALSSVTATSFDATIANAAGVMTQRAWVKFLRLNWLKLNITDVVCDIDTFLNIQNRTGRPTYLDQSYNGDERLNSVPTTKMVGIQKDVNFFITDGSPLGANTLVGLDRAKAMRRVVYVGADYSAVEEFVLRKGVGMRIDWAERIETNGYKEAFSEMTLT